MLMGTRSYKLLEGVRGEQGVDLAAIAEALQRISQLVTDFPQIDEMDINPFIVGKLGEDSVRGRRPNPACAGRCAMTADTPIYDPDWRSKYRSMIMTAEQAVAKIRPGQRVFIGTGVRAAPAAGPGAGRPRRGAGRHRDRPLADPRRGPLRGQGAGRQLPRQQLLHRRRTSAT